MKKFSFFLSLAIILTACRRDYNESKNPYDYFPTETSFILKINELNDFLELSNEQEVISAIYNKELKTASSVLQHLSPEQELYISFFKNGAQNSDYLILTQNDSTLLVTDSIPNYTSNTLGKSKIKKAQVDSLTFYHKTFRNVFAASNSLKIIKSISESRENKVLSELIETTNDKAVASVIFKINSGNSSKLLFNVFKEDSTSSNYAVLDLDHAKGQLKFNGIINSQDSITTFMDCFKHTIPQKISIPNIAPATTKSLYSVSYDNFYVLKKNLQQLENKDIDSTQTFLNFTNEIAHLKFKKNKALILHALDADLVLENIEDKSIFETYRELDIYKVENEDFFESRLKPIISFKKATYFTSYENFIIFSDTVETVKLILGDALNNNVLSSAPAFTNIADNLSDEASLLIFKNSEAFSEILGEPVKNYDANVVQYIYEKDYAHVNGIFQKYKRRATSNSIEESFTTKVEAEIIMPPQAVKNHITNDQDIAVQDINNTLYLISNSGAILWKKQLQSKILGKIEQIDRYKNGRLQLVFATENRVYLLDRNGKDVSSFPLKFNDKITQPLSVFDYDKNKKYRILVTQGKNLIMYDAKGQRVRGFDYTNIGYDISSQPKHFRIGSKDYIAFTAGENFEILNRLGKTRITVMDKFKFSDNEVFLYQDKITTTNMLGQLLQVNTSGKLSTKNLHLPTKHKFVTTSKTLVSMHDNKLTIKSKTIDLDFGDYTAPRIFYLNDKIYVTVTDLQAKKVYVFDSQAQSIPNFPVFGTSAAEIKKLNKDKGLELITQSDSKTVIMYKLY